MRYNSTVLTAAADSASEPLLITNAAEPAVNCIPGAGGTARVEVSLSPVEAIRNGTANWLPWPHGDVATPTQDEVVIAINALRLVATGAAATCEVVQ